MISRLICLALGTACFAFAVGCEPGTNETASTDADPTVILSEAPSDPLSLTEVKEQFTDEEAEAPNEITLVGKVDAGEFEAFEPNSATFMLSELPDEDHTGGDPDHADNCPFCKRRLANAPKAVVKLVDESGTVRATRADKLAGLSKGDVVTVSGTVSYDEGVNLITIQSQKIHIR
ncbi:OB-fold nucleic acid binding domain-containing protein [Rhodopirellula baltica]|uniref:Uncharacterized protein n=1 Tax=Rhodopirellula baltica WH47 TaxID=991778 RepID=F2ATH1_RHOBT|nr:OB-fold nucleic acid binding domain-containing protein [Rhodopirellula baltica]EGF27011.1 hypothetical protein RBWH47_05601 [Rhodopirellula baltica WH47]